MLLIVTVFHATVEAICLTLVSLNALGVILSNEWGQGSLSQDLIGVMILALVPYLAFLLYTEFRGFRPMRSTERLTLLSIMSASLLPIGVGCCFLLGFFWRGKQQHLNESLACFTIGFIWIVSVGLRAWLAFGKRGKSPNHVFSEEPLFS